MKWFKDVSDLDTLRRMYKRLVIQYHPDNCGSDIEIKQINAEYDLLFAELKSKYESSQQYEETTDKQKQQFNWEKDKQIREMVMQLSKFKNIKVEIIGVWIWVSECYDYRKELKELGFRWARQKQMWYIHFDDFHKFGSKPASMNYIRNKYGSVEVRFSKGKQDKEENGNRRIKAL